MATRTVSEHCQTHGDLHESLKSLSCEMASHNQQEATLPDGRGPPILTTTDQGSVVLQSQLQTLPKCR